MNGRKIDQRREKSSKKNNHRIHPTSTGGASHPRGTWSAGALCSLGHELEKMGNNGIVGSGTKKWEIMRSKVHWKHCIVTIISCFVFFYRRSPLFSLSLLQVDHLLAEFNLVFKDDHLQWLKMISIFQMVDTLLTWKTPFQEILKFLLLTILAGKSFMYVTTYLLILQFSEPVGWAKLPCC